MTNAETIRGKCGEDWAYEVIKVSGKNLQHDDYPKGVRYPDKASSWIAWGQAVARVSKTPFLGRLAFSPDTILGFVKDWSGGSVFLIGPKGDLAVPFGSIEWYLSLHGIKQ